MKKGMILTFEGIDGCGKSTQIVHLVQYLRDHGLDVVQLKDPGSTDIGEKLRSMALYQTLTPMTELLIFAAARQAMYDEIIKPSVENNKIVLIDRFIDSSYAYQGIAKHLKSEVMALESIVADGRMPDHTIFLDVTLKESATRIAKRKGIESDKFDNETTDFRFALYQGFSQRANIYKHRITRIDGSGTIDEVKERIQRWANGIFKFKDE